MTGLPRFVLQRHNLACAAAAKQSGAVKGAGVGANGRSLLLAEDPSLLLLRLAGMETTGPGHDNDEGKAAQNLRPVKDPMR